MKVSIAVCLKICFRGSEKKQNKFTSDMNSDAKVKYKMGNRMNEVYGTELIEYFPRMVKKESRISRCRKDY